MRSGWLYLDAQSVEGADVVDADGVDVSDGVAVVVHLLHAPGAVVGHVHAQSAAAGAGERHQFAVLLVELDGEVAGALSGGLPDLHLRQHVGAGDCLFHILEISGKDKTGARNALGQQKNRPKAV